MHITKNIHHQGKISELAERFSVFDIFAEAEVKKSAKNRWTITSTGEVSHHFTVAFFGKTGYGKSSTVNAFFGRDVMETSDIDACTRVCNCLDYEMSPGSYFSLGDFPGVGESSYRDTEYLDLYKKFMDSVDVVIYVMRADARDYTIDEKAYKTIFDSEKNRRKVVIALNQCDKIEPVSRKTRQEPTTEQMQNIEEKIKFLQQKFKPENRIVPYSASTGWGMADLASEMVNAAVASEEIDLSIAARIQLLEDAIDRLIT